MIETAAAVADTEAEAELLEEEIEESVRMGVKDGEVRDSHYASAVVCFAYLV